MLKQEIKEIWNNKHAVANNYKKNTTYYPALISIALFEGSGHHLNLQRHSICCSKYKK